MDTLNYAVYLPPALDETRKRKLEEFWQHARREHSGSIELNDHEVRWIGGDQASTAAILEHVRSGDKTGTVSLPAVYQNTGRQQPKTGDALLLVNFDASPAMIVQITATEIVPFGDITEQHTRVDGPRVRDLSIWIPIHKPYFTMLLSPYGLSCTNDTPVQFETFELICSA